MTQKKNWLGILVMVLGLTVIGCDNGSTDNSTDNSTTGSNPNGIWKMQDPYEIFFELKMNNGNWEVSGLDGPGLVLKGTYTVNNNVITFSTTHFYGGAANLPSPTKWYTKAEMAATGYFDDEDDEEDYLDLMFGMFDSATYSESSDTISLWDSKLIRK